MLTGYLTTLPKDCLFNAGVLYYAKAGAYVPIGVTEGAPDFDAASDQAEIMFDNRAPSRLKGLTRVVGVQPIVKGTLKEFGPSASGWQIAVLEPGETEVTASGVTTATPRNASALFASGDYITEFRWIFERSGGGYACVYAPLAIVRKWGMKGVDKKEALISFELEIVGDPVNDFSMAPYVIELRTQLPSSTPATPEALVAAVNSAGTTQITHAWAPGRGHTTSLGRKTDIADFVGGGADGVLHLVTDFVGANGAGIKYDPSLPDRFTWDTSSMKVVAAHDLDLGSSRVIGFVGKMNTDITYFLQSHNGSGSNGFKVDYGTTGFYGVHKDDIGAPGSYRFALSAKRDGLVRHLGLSWNPSETNAQPAMQFFMSRDHRVWIGGGGDAGGTSGYTGSRTLQLGNVFGGGSADNQTGDFRFLYVASGVLNAAQLKLINDFAELVYSAVTDTNAVFYFSGNSIVTTQFAQWASQLLTQLGASWHVIDLGRSGYRWSDLTARAPFVEALMDASKRTKAAHGLYEWTNSANIVTYSTAAAFYAAAKTASQSLHDAIGGAVKKVGITMLPEDSTYAHNSANGLSLDSERVATNALMVADAYWDVVYDAGSDAIMGQYTTTPNTTYYTDGTHPTTSTGTPIIALGLKNKLLTL